MAVLISLLVLLCQALSLAIVIWVLLSWVRPSPGHPLVVLLGRITEPVLRPLRRVLPRTGMFDFSPVVAIILLQLVISLLVRR
ncbi:MAG: YggT family protein [Chloroflexota bacterium]